MLLCRLTEKENKSVLKAFKVLIDEMFLKLINHGFSSLFFFKQEIKGMWNFPLLALKSQAEIHYIRLSEKGAGPVLSPLRYLQGTLEA